MDMKDLVITLSDKPDGEQLPADGAVAIDIWKGHDGKLDILEVKFLKSVLSYAQDKLFWLFRLNLPVFFTIKNIVTNEVVMESGDIKSIENLEIDGCLLNSFVVEGVIT